MFSLACNLTKNDVEFLPVEISSKKVRVNNVDFSTVKITLKKVSGKRWIFQSSKLHRKRYVEVTWVFWPSKLSWKNNVETTLIFRSAKLHWKRMLKWRGNSSKFGLPSSTSNRRGSDVVFPLGSYCSCTCKKSIT